MRKQESGFTLMELMIAVVIVAILASIAYPSYIGSVRKAKRTDAKEAILRIQNLQEKWRTNNTSYATFLQLSSPPTAEGYYTISIPVNTTVAYTITATAVGDQLKDNAGGTICSPMQLAVSAGGEVWTPAGCW